MADITSDHDKGQGFKEWDMTERNAMRCVCRERECFLPHDLCECGCPKAAVDCQQMEHEAEDAGERVLDNGQAMREEGARLSWTERKAESQR